MGATRKWRGLLPVSLVVAALLLPDPAGAGKNWTWGVAAGMPQTLALSLEYRADTPVRIQAHAGTILVISSVAVRAVAISSRGGVAPYAFLGAGAMNVAEGDGGGAVGSTGFAWGGAGLRLPTGGLTWFGELGVLWGLNQDNGYDSAMPGVAIGVGFGSRTSSKSE